MIKNNRYDQPMTTLGQLVNATAAKPLDLGDVIASVALLASAHAPALGSLSTIVASCTAWTQQDDDAHEPCSLTACRNPLHPGPCKGWKHTLHSVSPHIYKQLEDERVKKANERRVKRIADLRSQGKPIPRRLLTEIKPKPAPTHPAHNAQAVPLGQVNQKADLAGGQAHTAGQAVTKAAGVQVKTAPALPLGPKQKKPTVAGRGPAFVITQPKVTDTYKLDKADKITPQEWAGLTDADKATIRNELTAIKARGFGPQQTKADALLAKLPAPTPATSKLTPGTPGTITTPGGHTYQKVNLAPGKVTLGQAVKNHVSSTPAQAGSFTQATTAIRIAEALHGVQATDTQKLASVLEAAKQSGPLDQNPKFRLLVDRLANDALKQASADNMPGLGHGANDVGITEFNHQIRDHILEGKPGLPPLVERTKNHHQVTVVTNAPAAKLTPPVTPAGPTPQAPGPPNNTPQAFAPHVQHARAVAGRALGGRPTAKGHVETYGKLTKAEFDSLDSPTQRTIRDDLANAKAKFLDPKKQQEAADLLDRFGSRHPVSTSTAATPGAMDKPTALRLEGEVQAAPSRDAAVALISHLDTGHLQKMSDHLGRGTVTPSMKPEDARGAMVTAIRGRAPRRDGSSFPAAPHPKGYSDPQQEAVKAATSGLIDTDKVLQTVARLSPGQVGRLDDTDRKAILGRLAFVATHPKATDEQKAKATAYGRIINGGTHVPSSQKFDHEPSIGELHGEEKKGGHQAIADALQAANNLNAPLANQRADRIKALMGLTRAQFDSLHPDKQRLITDALQELHVEKPNGLGASSKLSPEVETAFDTYTGLTPGIHRLKQAEADFRAGIIDGAKLYDEFVHARVQEPGSSYTPGSRGHLLEKEAQRIAEDNPKLPLWTRASLIQHEYNAPGGAYQSIVRASSRYDWTPAPRLSSNDISDIFRANVDDLANVHPIHAEAVKGLREHLILTGLKGDPGVPSGSPWGISTRGHVVDNLLHTSVSSPEVPPERLKEFDALPSMGQVLVRRVLTERINSQTNASDKVATFITLNTLERRHTFTPEQNEALKVASDRFAGRSDIDAYRKLTPDAFDELPPYARDAIRAHLAQAQTRAEASGPVLTWSAQDNPFKVMPGTLADHLTGTRTSYPDRRVRSASDIANFGTKIVNPYDRTRAYSQVPIAEFRKMSQGDQDLIHADLDKIAADPAHSLQIRYGAQLTKDFLLGGAPKNLNVEQVVAVGAGNPTQKITDSAAEKAFADLSKADFDKLDKTYRDAIDERIKALPGFAQQSLTAKFHPAAPQAANPSGMTPTTVQANVPPHVQAALDTIYGVHPKSHTMAHQLSTYGALRGHDFNALNSQEQGHLLGDLSFIATTAKGPSGDKARKLIDRFTPAGTPSGHVPTGAIIPPANAVPGQQRYATPLKGLAKAKDSGTSGDGWMSLPGGGRVWGHHGAAGLLLQHTDQQTGEKRYLMVQRGPAISDPGKWTFPGGASDSKETPHEGATRETIEELGLKDDVFKDALVHGDHTFTVPNSSWKYTTVAASVPTMIKPNLTTAHARAETSDAKWMTLDEIRALDKAGDLHHPIAGGKLEQNVISLYPQGTGQTLGQAVRPGPVNKRLARLNLPSGGRQAPGQYNAWPHAHKPSKGKNLVGDKPSIDAQRQQIKKDRVLYDGKTADGRLAAIGAQQGFDDTPTVMSKDEVNKLLATGDYIEAWRGVSGAGGGWSARSRGHSGGKTAEQINEEMRSGPAYYGKGVFGNGYYLATSKQVAEQYSDHTKGSIVRILIPKSAVTEKYDKVEREAQSNSSRMSKAKGSSSFEVSTFWDPGRWGAAKGLDGIEINPHHRAHGGGGAGHVASHGKPAFNWLNRSVLILQKEPG